jgi:uncharacterized protein (TIGR00255 family)
MTGFGKTQVLAKGKNITIEVRSLNSRQADLNLKLPVIYREKEYEIRNTVIDSLERGKIDVSINVDFTNSSHAAILNMAVAKNYFDQLKTLEKELGLDRVQTDYIGIISRMPEVFRMIDSEINQEEWDLLIGGLKDALCQVIGFRKEEGSVLEKDIGQRIGCIEKLLQSIQPYEEERIDLVRNKILKELMALPIQPSYDKNRFEQEMIYWLEKIDFTEEKTRLSKHLHHFLRTLEEESSQGKKLGFIAQEIGREINTLGSKANHAEIQRIVISMKDELEKIKEQLLNVL